MPNPLGRNPLWRLVMAISLAWLGAVISLAEQLPIRVWTTADGLPHNHINRIKRDTRGYLWICTDEGLARFDGYRFVNYGKAHGLPNLTVNDFLEARDGTYWIATDGGVCQFNPLGQAASPNVNQANSTFTVYRVSEREETNHVNGMLEDPDGSLWLATAGGLFHLQRAGGQVRLEAVEIGFPTGYRDERHVTNLFRDSRGTLWVMAVSGLYRRTNEGRWERYGLENGLLNNFVQSMFEDKRGRLWLGSRSSGLYLLVAHPQAGQRIVERNYSIRTGLPGIDIRNITALPDGRVWLCMVGGLVAFHSDASDESKFRVYTTAHGLTTDEIYNLTEDSEGNLWVGTRSSGVMRIAGSGFTTFGVQDGFTPGPFNTLLESANGELLIFNGTRPAQRFFQVFDGQQFGRVEHKVRDGFGYSREQSILQDRFGEWWVATDQGVHRYAQVRTVTELAKAKPRAIYDQQNGLSHHYVERLFEDERGDIWMGSGFTGSDTTESSFLHRWNRATEKLHRYHLPGDVVPAINFSAIGEDAQGNLWLANIGIPGLTRYRNGQFKRFTVADGAPTNTVNAFFLDRKQRLWIATSNSGIHRMEESATDRLRLTSWDVTKGLATNEVWSITEDQWGRIYAGTGRGVDRLDPETGYIQHFTAADGLAKGEVRESLRDSHNQLWFVTEQGVSRLSPRLEEPKAVPPVLITAVRINGNPAPLSELGETKIENLLFEPEQNSVQIDFVSLDFSAGGRLHYQYQLNREDWSAPDAVRTISFANLAPGNYHFAVRAISESGAVSAEAASLRFTILRPVWQRWWFVLMSVIGLAGIGYGLHRYRLAQFMHVEQVRTRIARDLHDDVGSGLSQISLLSEIIQRRAAHDAAIAEPLSAIAGTSRELVDTMSDIVWTNNPRFDHLGDLVHRCRRFATESLTARGIRLHMDFPDNDGDLTLEPETRRQLYLIFKEAITNLARHADCDQAEISLRVENGWLQMRIADNGNGFAAEHQFDGNGLRSLRARAEAIGGTLEIESAPNAGTTLTLRLQV